ncbi:MAG: AAA family ATPase [Methanofastidiosum sp.]
MNLAAPLSGSTLLGSAGLLALITALWDKIKLYWSKVWGLIFVTMDIGDDGYQAIQAIQRLLVKEFKKTSLDNKVFTALNEYVRPRQKNQVVAFEIIPRHPTTWWRNKRPLIVSNMGGKITFIRGTYDAKDFLLEAVEKYNIERSNKDYKSLDRFFVRRMYGDLGKEKGAKNYGSRGGDESKEVAKTSPSIAQNGCDSDKYTMFPLKWTNDELGQPKKDSAIADMSLSPEVLDVFQECVRWRESEEWFKQKGVPWKRGVLMYGQMGTGKTAFTRALGQELNMPIFSFDLATMSNSSFNDAWNMAKSYCPCIVLLEDIDGVFDGRKNIACNGMERGLSFDCLLNLIDGVENSDGIFLVVTTNDLSKIDPAIGGIVNGNGMSTRPGRIDKIIEFKYLDKGGREKMAKRILGDFDISLWDHLLDEKHEDSGAQFQERCCKLALKLFWKNKK